MLRKYSLLLAAMLLCAISVIAGLSHQKYYQVVCGSRSHGSNPTLYSCMTSYSAAKEAADAHMKNNPGHSATVMNESGCNER